jgi:hypothetical protein
MARRPHLRESQLTLQSGFIFIGYNVGNIVAAYLVFTQEVTVKYRSTWIAVIVSMVAASLMSLVLRWAFKRENKRRDALPPNASRNSVEASEERDEKDLPGASGGVMPPVLPGMEDYRDRTDREIPEFRYSL